jgi:hypothetical protein
MEIRKATSIETGGAADGAALAEINRFSRRALTAEEVYLFSVRLCDNEIDRDYERFDDAALAALAELFVGKSGIFDHEWNARNQTARIYRTEVVPEPGRTNRAGGGYRWLKGYAYMLRTEKNADLIGEIEGGIKREVSVGCAVAKSVCSVCGAPGDGACGHVRGKYYNGALCHTVLSEVTDAFEWSFVAVPAQPAAGVVKGLFAGRENLPLADLLRGTAHFDAYTKLAREAELGRKYLDTLRSEVVRLGMLADRSMQAAAMTKIASGLGEEELLSLRRAYEKRLEELLPPIVQLPGRSRTLEEQEADRAFLI